MVMKRIQHKLMEILRMERMVLEPIRQTLILEMIHQEMILLETTPQEMILQAILL